MQLTISFWKKKRPNGHKPSKSRGVSFFSHNRINTEKGSLNPIDIRKGLAGRRDDGGIGNWTPKAAFAEKKSFKKLLLVVCNFQRSWTHTCDTCASIFLKTRCPSEFFGFESQTKIHASAERSFCQAKMNLHAPHRPMPIRNSNRVLFSFEGKIISTRHFFLNHPLPFTRFFFNGKDVKPLRLGWRTTSS